MKIFNTRNFIGSIIFMLSIPVFSGPFTVTAKTLESVRIEAFYSAKTDTGRLNAIPVDCSTCSTQSLPLNKSATISYQGKAVVFDEMLTWKNVTADVDYDTNTNSVIAIRRH